MTERSTDPGTVLARLAKLERQNRRMKVAGAACVLLLGGLLLTAGNQPQDVLRARGFCLVDDAGNTRGFWGYSDSLEETALYVGTPEGREAGLALRAGGISASLCVFGDGEDRQRLPRLRLGLLKGIGLFTLSDQNDVTRVSVMNLPEFGPRIATFDAAGQTTYGAPF
ncbi:MAG: hypothetical protein KAY32_01710 [Candidatus Eisenbacteria sp.]|nr:hypothetical protein [Candidatus Eisenbacteria bacterium]